MQGVVGRTFCGTGSCKVLKAGQFEFLAHCATNKEIRTAPYQVLQFASGPSYKNSKIERQLASEPKHLKRGFGYRFNDSFLSGVD